MSSYGRLTLSLFIRTSIGIRWMKWLVVRSLTRTLLIKQSWYFSPLPGPVIWRRETSRISRPESFPERRDPERRSVRFVPISFQIFSSLYAMVWIRKYFFRTVLRIRDPVLFGPLNPGWKKNLDQDLASGMNSPGNFSESIETIFWIKNTYILLCRSLSGIRDLYY